MAVVTILCYFRIVIVNYRSFSFNEHRNLQSRGRFCTKLAFIFTGIMGLLNQDALNRVNKLIWIGKTLFHWGFIPSILLLGFAKGAEPGMPELTLASLLWA